MKFKVGDIIKKSIDKVGSSYVYVLVIGHEETNPHYTPVYKVMNLVTNREHTWNTNHVDFHYERVS